PGGVEIGHHPEPRPRAEPVDHRVHVERGDLTGGTLAWTRRGVGGAGGLGAVEANAPRTPMITQGRQLPGDGRLFGGGCPGPDELEESRCLREAPMAEELLGPLEVTLPGSEHIVAQEGSGG